MFRRFPTFLFALALAAPFSVRAQTVRSVGGAPVVGVQSTRTADLVLVGAGFEAGLRQGMVCRITRGNQTIGEIQLVELRNRAGAALILRLEPGQSIHVGDLATVKVLKV